jgi:hypothetical protein
MEQRVGSDHVGLLGELVERLLERRGLAEL